MSSILRGTSIVAVLTLLSRLLGFVRDLLVARVFGTGLFADAYVVAFRVPNLLRSIFAEGALSSAFVPTFATEINESRERGQKAIHAVTSFLVIVTSIAAVLGIIFAPQVVGFFAPGFGENKEKFDLCVLLTRIMMPYIVFVSVIAMLNGALNTVKVFGTSAMAQVVMNVILIAGAVIALFVTGGRNGTIILSTSVLVGGLAQVIAQIPALKRSGFHLKLVNPWGSPAVRATILLMIPAIFGSAIYQLSVFLTTFLATLVREGSVSWLFYADRVVQLPIGVYSIALASVLLPSLTMSHAKGDSSSFANDLSKSLCYTTFIIAPIALVLFLFAEPTVAFLFQKGAFTAESSYQTARAIRAQSFGIWAVSCHSMVTRAFVARKNPGLPAIVGAGSLVIEAILSVLFMGQPVSGKGSYLFESVVWLQHQLMIVFPEQISLGHAGLALASSLATILAFMVLAFLLGRKIKTFSFHNFLKGSYRTLFGVLFAYWIVTMLPLQGFRPVYQLLFGVPSTFLIYLGIMKLLGSPEFNETFSLVRRLGARKLRS